MIEAGTAARARPFGWLWVLPVAGGLFFLTWYLHTWSDRIEPGRITEASFRAGPAPPIETPARGAAETVQLPHRWAGLQPPPSEGWYDVELLVDDSRERLWAVFLPAVRMNAAVYVNGHLIGSAGKLKPPVEHHWNHPLYFPLPGSMLESGWNRISVRVVSDRPGGGLLAPFHVAPDQELRNAYWFVRFFRVSLAEIVIAFSVTVSAFMATLWLRRRRDTLYGWFALGIAVWTVHDLNLVVVSPPVGPVAWEWLRLASAGFFVILVVVFIHRFLGHVRPRVERALFGAGVGGSLVLAVVGVVDPPLMHFLGVHFWVAGVTSLGIYPAVMMINASRRRPGNEPRVLLVSGLLLLAFGAHDWMAHSGLIACDNGVLMHLSAPIVIGALAWVLLRRFASAVDELETLNRTLEERVARRSQEITRNYERIQRLENRELLARERERIMLDMHDGVGGQLVSLLALAESGAGRRQAILDGLRTTLEELRLTIDSLDPDYNNLEAAVSYLRQRMVPRLRSAGLEVQWPVAAPGLAEVALNPGQLLQVVRVLQEALTNVLKHARARKVEVGVRVETDSDGAQRTVVEIQDDGEGIRPDAREGRGLGGMRRRAGAIGGELEIDSSPGGTRVRLTLPGRPPREPS